MTAVDLSARKRANGAGGHNTEHETMWEAFAAAQEEFGPVVKGKQGARGKYAPLDAVLDAVRPVLHKHGFALTQPTRIDGETLIVSTRIVWRKTGDAHDCDYPAGSVTLQHQQLGAGVTYARRYALLALLGVFPEDEDDDGEKAGSAGARRAQREEKPQEPTPQQLEEFAANAASALNRAETKDAIDKQWKRIQDFWMWAFLDERDPKAANHLRKTRTERLTAVARGAPADDLNDEIPF